MDTIKLPPEGIFVGSGIYPTETDTLLCTMTGHYSWQCQHFTMEEQLEKVLSDNQGNLVQLWGIPRGFSPRVIGEWVYDLPRGRRGHSRPRLGKPEKPDPRGVPGDF